jgi:hypothetical protein
MPHTSGTGYLREAKRKKKEKKEATTELTSTNSTKEGKCPPFLCAAIPDPFVPR